LLNSTSAQDRTEREGNGLWRKENGKRSLKEGRKIPFRGYNLVTKKKTRIQNRLESTLTMDILV